MHKNKLHCRTYLQHENYTNIILKSWGWGSGAMVVVSSTLGVGCAEGRCRRRWWGDGVVEDGESEDEGLRENSQVSMFACVCVHYYISTLNHKISTLFTTTTTTMC